MKRSQLLIGLVLGGGFSVIYSVVSAFVNAVLWRLFGTPGDDIRFDFILPIFITAYLAAAIITFLIGLGMQFIEGITFDRKAHIRFLVAVPVIFIFSYVFLILVFWLKLPIDALFNNVNVAFDTILIQAIFIGGMAIGYYYVLTRKKAFALKGLR